MYGVLNLACFPFAHLWSSGEVAEVLQRFGGSWPVVRLLVGTVVAILLLGRYRRAVLLRCSGAFGVAVLLWLLLVAMRLRFRGVGIGILNIKGRYHEYLQYRGFVRHAHCLVACLVAGVHRLTHGFGLNGAAVDCSKAVFHLQGKLNHDGAVLVGPDLAVFVEDFRRGEYLVFYKERVQ